jgi:signal transduction histidine kinase/CheY-like chemotaxis protein
MREKRIVRIIENLNYYSETFASIPLTNLTEVGRVAVALISSILNYQVAAVLFIEDEDGEPRLLASKGINQDSLDAWNSQETLIRHLLRDINISTVFKCKTLNESIASSALRLGLCDMFLAAPLIAREHEKERIGFVIAARPGRNCEPDVDIMGLEIIGGIITGAISNCIARTKLLEAHARIQDEIMQRKRAEKEMKGLEARLLQAQKMEAIATLSGGIAHDFNNLLTGIQGNISLMFLDIDTEHPHYERLKSIEQQIESGARLTSHLLGYARKGRYEVKPIDFNRLMEDASQAFGRTRKQITINRELAEDLLAIEADRGQIEQVLWNLFVNASDAMLEGGVLTLKTANVTDEDMKGRMYQPKPGNYVQLMVTDTGTGMDKETMERVFDPFFTTKEMGRGTGLGLASVYGVVKGHGGYIDVYSEKGTGSTFSTYLPASQERVEKAVEITMEVTKGTGTVLLVDDEDVILEVGKDLLGTMGYRVLLAGDGREAVEVYGKNCDVIDIVILDMVMPTMGGGEAYDRMKEINPKVKVLLSSGYSIDGKATEIMDRGCSGFIQKPFTMQELSIRIGKLLEEE